MNTDRSRPAAPARISSSPPSQPIVLNQDNQPLGKTGMRGFTPAFACLSKQTEPGASSADPGPPPDSGGVRRAVRRLHTTTA
jgi:hypothetical protein